MMPLTIVGIVHLLKPTRQKVLLTEAAIALILLYQWVPDFFGWTFEGSCLPVIEGGASSISPILDLSYVWQLIQAKCLSPSLLAALIITVRVLALYIVVCLLFFLYQWLRRRSKGETCLSASLRRRF